MRAVLDTNLVVSYALNHNSRAAQAYRLAVMSCTLLASQETADELIRVLTRPKMDRFSTLARRQAVLEGYLLLVAMCPVTHTVTDCRDPTDNKFLALALSGRADLLVSGDDDLLVLHPWRSIPILSPADYLARPV